MHPRVEQWQIEAIVRANIGLLQANSRNIAYVCVSMKGNLWGNVGIFALMRREVWPLWLKVCRISTTRQRQYTLISTTNTRSAHKYGWSPGPRRQRYSVTGHAHARQCMRSSSHLHCVDLNTRTCGAPWRLAPLLSLTKRGGVRVGTARDLNSDCHHMVRSDLYLVR